MAVAESDTIADGGSEIVTGPVADSMVTGNPAASVVVVVGGTVVVVAGAAVVVLRAVATGAGNRHDDHQGEKESPSQENILLIGG